MKDAKDGRSAPSGGKAAFGKGSNAGVEASLVDRRSTAKQVVGKPESQNLEMKETPNAEERDSNVSQIDSDRSSSATTAVASTTKVDSIRQNEINEQLSARPEDLARQDQAASTIVSARGTSDGLVLRIDSRASHESILRGVRNFISARKSFLEGGQVELEWIGSGEGIESQKAVATLLKDEFNIDLIVNFKAPNEDVAELEDSSLNSGFSLVSGGLSSNSKLRSNQAEQVVQSSSVNGLDLFDFEESFDVQRSQGPQMNREARLIDSRTGLSATLADQFGGGAQLGSGSVGQESGIGRHPLTSGLNKRSSWSAESILGAERRMGEALVTKEGRARSQRAGAGQSPTANRYSEDLSEELDLEFWDQPEGRMIYHTLRSGERLETEHSVVVLGDVNAGAEIVAGGDIIVLGTLRGIAHAGAYDESGGGRIIFALVLRPTQLRIGSIISRGSDEIKQLPEIARVDGSIIIVERYQPRGWQRHRF